jgi:hypothetical protein
VSSRAVSSRAGRPFRDEVCRGYHLRRFRLVLGGGVVVSGADDVLSDEEVERCGERCR